MHTGDDQLAETLRIEINDPFAYTTGNKLIAEIIIKSHHGSAVRKLIRTKKGGYLLN